LLHHSLKGIAKTTFPHLLFHKPKKQEKGTLPPSPPSLPPSLPPFLPVNEGVDALLDDLGVGTEEGQLGEHLGSQLLVGQDLGEGREGGRGF